MVWTTGRVFEWQPLCHHFFFYFKLINDMLYIIISSLLVNVGLPLFYIYIYIYIYIYWFFSFFPPSGEGFYSPHHFSGLLISHSSLHVAFSHFIIFILPSLKVFLTFSLIFFLFLLLPLVTFFFFFDQVHLIWRIIFSLLL